jgi:hypothetical protein
MDIAELITAIEKDQLNITSHARVEAREDSLLLDEILHSVRNGEVIEDYPDDTPYPSGLVYGTNEESEPIHSVLAFDDKSGIAVLITVYRPDPDRWIDWKERKQI